jgi:hypothetical protein
MDAGVAYLDTGRSLRICDGAHGSVNSIPLTVSSKIASLKSARSAGVSIYIYETVYDCDETF